MAFFKFRKSSADAPQPKAQVQSIETLRQRAKYRLAGATVLILVGVVGLPLLFDKQPRPIAVDTPIDIPDKNKVPPLVIPAAPKAASNQAKPAVTEPAVVANPEAVVSGAAEKPVVTQKEAPAPAASVAPVTPLALPLAVKPVAEAPATAPVVVNRAQALLNGQNVATTPSKPNSADATNQRVVVQVGAFADAARAQEVRWKIEKAGLRTYTQVADTKDGKRIRVRVGPFETHAEADKAAARIKKLDLPAVLLTL